MSAIGPRGQIGAGTMDPSLRTGAYAAVIDRFTVLGQHGVRRLVFDWERGPNWDDCRSSRCYDGFRAAFPEWANENVGAFLDDGISDARDADWRAYLAALGAQIYGDISGAVGSKHPEGLRPQISNWDSQAGTIYAEYSDLELGRDRGLDVAGPESYLHYTRAPDASYLGRRVRGALNGLLGSGGENLVANGGFEARVAVGAVPSSHAIEGDATACAWQDVAILPGAVLRGRGAVLMKRRIGAQAVLTQDVAVVPTERYVFAVSARVEDRSGSRIPETKVRGCLAVRFLDDNGVSLFESAPNSQVLYRASLQYKLSAYLRAPSGSAIASAQIRWLDVRGAVVEKSDEPPLTLGPSFREITVAGAAPISATGAILVLRIDRATRVDIDDIASNRTAR